MKDQDEQLGFELGGEQAATVGPNLHEIREDLAAILDEARHMAGSDTWDAATLRYKKIVFLRLVTLLPDGEGEQLSFDFLDQLERIEALRAA